MKWKCFWQLNWVLMLNWTVFNRTDYLHKKDLALNNLKRLICYKTQQTKPFLCSQLGQPSPQFSKFSSFLLIMIRSGRLADIKLSVPMSKFHESLWVSYSRIDAWVVHIPYISHMVNFRTQSCLVLYSFCTNLLHSLYMWLIVSSLPLHNLHLRFCCILSILALIRLVLMVLLCADYYYYYFLL